MSQPRQFQQGDVFLLEVRGRFSKKGFKPVAREGGRVVLAHGELTGHAHAIADPGARLLQHNSGERLLELARSASLHHEEHGDIKLPKGLFRVVRQREYERGSARLVAD